jgi:hypothetical protein
MKAKTLLPFLLLLLLLFGCNNYGMRDKLENPGGGSNLAGSPSSPPSGPPPTYRIFVTSLDFTGDLGGIAGADGYCQIDSNKPGPGIWKAMLVDGADRWVCNITSCDWVLKPNATYVRANDGALISHTNGNALLTFPLSNSIGTSGVQIWTGLNVDWTTDASNTCTGWTITSGDGACGEDNDLNSGVINTGTYSCAFTRPLYCVEQ